MTNPHVIVIEGIISAGKTELVSRLKVWWESKGKKVVTIFEPVDMWKKIGILEEFYKNPKANAYKFQTFAYITRIKVLLDQFNNNPDADIYILERSVYSDKHFFVQTLIDDGVLDSTEEKMYNAWWEMWSHIVPLKPSKFVYLKPHLNECMKRLKLRNRKGEEGIPREYQEKLMIKHDNFFKHSSVEIGNEKIETIIVETNDDFRYCEKILERIADQILKYS